MCSCEQKCDVMYPPEAANVPFPGLPETTAATADCSRYWTADAGAAAAIMSSLSRAQSWPLLSGAAPAEDARNIKAKSSQVRYVFANV